MENILNLIIIAMLVVIALEVYLLSGRRTRSLSRKSEDKILIDTSVLMDGRIIELAKSGFLLGEIIVPRSVLGELQLLADGSDGSKREKARKGMDIVNELKHILGDHFLLYDDDERADEGVDSRLLLLAKQLNASIMTLDYNLNKVAKVVDVQVLNINELAKSLRMSHLPGEIIELELTTSGQESGQAVGHLSDGTMTVVEGAKKYIGQTKRVEIIRSLQTDAGKMMFAKLANEPSSSVSGSNSHKQRQPNTVVRHKIRSDRTPNSSNRSRQSKPESHTPHDSKPQGSRSRKRLSQSQHEDELVKLANR